MASRTAASLAAALTLGLFPRVAAADEFDALRGDFLAAINAERARDAVVPLRLSHVLGRLAQELAEELSRRGERDFGDVSEAEVLSRAEKAGYPVKTLTEIYTHVDGSIPEVIASWPKRDERTWRTLVRGNGRDLGIGAAMLEDVPLYVFLLGLSADDFLAGRAAEYRDLADMRRQMLARVNAERGRRSLPALAPSARLDRVAQVYADDMLKRSHYGHVDPEGLTVRERAFAGGYPLRFIAENLASGQATVDEVMDGWMGSETHRENILSKIYTEAGFGLAIGKNKRGYQIIWVQVFGRARIE